MGKPFASLDLRDNPINPAPAGRFLSSITPVNGVLYADGYQMSSLRFLQLFPSVRRLFLSDNHLQDLSVLQGLPNLERVHLDGNLLDLSPGSEEKASNLTSV